MNHGVVVALYCPIHGRFVRLVGRKASASQPTSRLRLSDVDKSSQFMVIWLGNNEIALYCIASQMLLAMSSHQVVGVPHSKRLHGTTDVAFINAIPQKAKFTFGSNTSNGRTIALFSKHCRRYVRMTFRGSVDGEDKCPKQWETYEIILIMNIVT
jgi:hypothetical protein